MRNKPYIDTVVQDIIHVARSISLLDGRRGSIPGKGERSFGTSQYPHRLIIKWVPAFRWGITRQERESNHLQIMLMVRNTWICTPTATRLYGVVLN
jgi:hypothetical protein